MTQYSYSDVAGFDHAGLAQEISGAGLTVDGLIVDGTKLTVVGTLTAGQETTLNAIVAAHDPTGLTSNKLNRVIEVMRHSSDLIKEGVSYRSNMFSIDSFNLSILRSFRDALVEGTISLPISCMSIDSGLIEFATLVHVNALVSAGELRYQSITNGEHSLVVAISAAADQAALDAVTDTRT